MEISITTSHWKNRHWKTYMRQWMIRYCSLYMKCPLPKCLYFQNSGVGDRRIKNSRKEEVCRSPGHIFEVFLLFLAPSQLILLPGSCEDNFFQPHLSAVVLCLTMWQGIKTKGAGLEPLKAEAQRILPSFKLFISGIFPMAKEIGLSMNQKGKQTS